MGEDAAAAEGHVLASKATAERLDRTPPPGRPFIRTPADTSPYRRFSYLSIRMRLSVRTTGHAIP
jgi:hypothetical protein